MAAESSDVIDGRYEVGPVMGRGAMGEVRRGRDIRLGRDVAIKRLRPDLAADDGVRRRFQDEARAAARLNHASIVAVYDSGEWAGVPFLVMECLPGRTLADELADGPLPEERVREITLDIASALDAAHRIGVVHRDVKPSNILLTADGRAKLAAFGIAKSTETMDHTQTGLIIGTPAYLAPERLDGRAATPQSDLYSLGVVLYEAMTGERPFRGDTPVALAHAVHATTPVPLQRRLPGIDPRLATTIDAAMAKDPADRPPSAVAMGAMLDSDATTALSDTAAHLRAPPTVVLPVDRSDAAAWQRAVGRSWWPGRTGGERRALAAALVVVVLVLMVLVVGGGDEAGPPPTTVAPEAPPASVPPPLDDAIIRLEESVRP